MFNFLARLSLVLFISMTAFQLIHSDNKVEEFRSQYQEFEKQTKNVFGLQFHESITFKNIEGHFHIIAQIIGYLIIVLSVMTLFVSQRFTFLLGILYFVEQLILKNFLTITLGSKLQSIQEVILTVFILIASFALSCKNQKVIKVTQYVNNNKK